jgi:hypothetical protein
VVKLVVVALVTLFGPAAPVSPLGIVKLNTAALVVPLLVTLAFVPALPVVVVPTDTVAESPFGPTLRRTMAGRFTPCNSTRSGPLYARISTVEMLMV